MGARELVRQLPMVIALLLLGGCAATAPSVGPRYYNVKEYGARGDGKVLDTSAVNAAITAANAAGGGTVFFPAGTYRCFSIHLKNYVTIYLDQGTTILAANPLEELAAPGGYDPPEPNPWDKYQDFGHTHWHNSLIWGDGLTNIAIVGPGRIYGMGLSRAIPIRNNPHKPPYGETRDVITEPTYPTPRSQIRTYPDPRDALPSGVGNKAIALKNCRNVTLRDFSILHGGHFAILATGVDNLTIDNLKIDTNRDGIDIDCCRNVRVSNTSVNSPWDDAICLKSSYALGEPRCVENTTITNCMVSGGYKEGTLLDGTFQKIDRDYEAQSVRPTRTGRIKFGTESSGGFKNVTISNCVFDNCQGLALESVDGAILENVSITNLTMRDIISCPIFVRLGGRGRSPPDHPPVGTIRNINISNIVAVNSASRFACIITGIPGHDIENLRLNNIQIVWPGGVDKAHAVTQPAERITAYPETTMFRGMPAYGFFIRHVRGIELSDITFSLQQEDERPPFVLDDVRGAEFDDIKAPHAEGVPNFVLKNVEDFKTHQYRGLEDVQRDKVDQGQF